MATACPRVPAVSLGFPGEKREEEAGNCDSAALETQGEGGSVCVRARTCTSTRMHTCNSLEVLDQDWLFSSVIALGAHSTDVSL